MPAAGEDAWPAPQIVRGVGQAYLGHVGDSVLIQVLLLEFPHDLEELLLPQHHKTVPGVAGGEVVQGEGEDEGL